MRVKDKGFFNVSAAGHLPFIYGVKSALFLVGEGKKKFTKTGNRLRNILQPSRLLVTMNCNYEFCSVRVLSVWLTHVQISKSVINSPQYIRDKYEQSHS